jgi:L-asparaginase
MRVLLPVAASDPHCPCILHDVYSIKDPVRWSTFRRAWESTVSVHGDQRRKVAELDPAAEVLLISMGGTIAMRGRRVVPELDGEALLESIPRRASLGPVRAVPFRKVPGAQLGIADVIELAAEIRGAFEHGTRGVVVSQGTDTLEETAFALDLLLDGRRPVVITGAMRHPAEAGADGPANLADAVTVAAAPEVSGGLGVLVVLGGEIHSAQFVRKTHTVSPAAFGSLTGPLGWVTERRPVILTRPVRRLSLPLAEARKAAPVALLTVGIGDDGRLARAARDLGYEGLVIAALGAGHVPAELVGALGELASARPVVLCSRTGRGPVLQHTYGFAGSEYDLLSRGLISGGYLDGAKARVALSLLLGSGADRAAIRQFFENLSDNTPAFE